MKSIVSNLVINEIMSSKNGSTIVLTKSDPQHIQFLTALANNYRAAYRVNAESDIEYSLAYALAQKVFVDSDKVLNNLKQLLSCEMDFPKSQVIINAIVNHINHLNYNVLIIIDHMESSDSEDDYNAIETLMKNCPSNLKIVLVSEKFLNLNYAILVNTSPKLIENEKLNELQFDTEIVNESFSEEVWKLLYTFAKLGQVDIGFAEYLSKDIMTNIYKLSSKYAGFYLTITDKIFYINPELANIILEKGLVDEITFSIYEKRLFDYYTEQGNNYVKALKIALKRNDVRMVDYAVKKIIEGRRDSFLLEEIAGNTPCYMQAIDSRLIYARYFYLLCAKKAIGDYVRIIYEAKKLITELPSGHILMQWVRLCLILSMHANGQHYDAVEYAFEYLVAGVEQHGEDFFLESTKIIEQLAYGFHSLDMVAAVHFLKKSEKFLLNERFQNEFWYINILQVFVGINIELGNYKLAIKHLNTIKYIAPFYVIPYKMIIAYFFAGDMNLAKEIAENILEASKINGATANLTGAYVLLGLVSVYYNKIDDAVEYLNEAVVRKPKDESSMLNVIGMRAMLYAESGHVEYGIDLALLYVKMCENTGSHLISILYGATAYCYWRAGEHKEAFAYAKKCILGSTARSTFWLIATAIMVSYMLETEDYNLCKTSVEKFIHANINLGMEMICVICADLFEPIIRFAEDTGIEPEYSNFLKNKIKERNDIASTGSLPDIKLMGDTGVTVGGEQIQWKTKKAKELFLLYILRGKEGIARNDILEMFWGDYVYVSAINNLKTTNNIIRNTLNSHGIKYELEYVNSKYILSIKYHDTDYSAYVREFARAENETDIWHKVMIINHLITLYSSGFACDVKIRYFADLREKLRDELSLLITQVIQDLIKEKSYLEAKRYVNILKKIQPKNDYTALVAEIDKKILY